MGLSHHRAAASMSDGHPNRSDLPDPILAPLRSLIRLFGLRPQSRFARSVVLHFPRKHHIPQARFHRVEFRSRNDVFILLRQNPRDLFLRCSDAVWRRWMRREQLRNCPRPPLFVRLNPFKESDIALGSYPALYIYCRPRKSASLSASRENFRYVSGIANCMA